MKKSSNKKKNLDETIEFLFIVLTIAILSLGSQSNISNILEPKPPKPEACINLIMGELINIQAFSMIIIYPSIHSFYATIIFKALPYTIKFDRGLNIQLNVMELAQKTHTLGW